MAESESGKDLPEESGWSSWDRKNVSSPAYAHDG
jgi:hypothetical protein